MHYVLPGYTVERTAQKLENFIAYLSNGFSMGKASAVSLLSFSKIPPLSASLSIFFFFEAQVAIDQHLIVVFSHGNV